MSYKAAGMQRAAEENMHSEKMTSHSVWLDNKGQGAFECRD